MSDDNSRRRFLKWLGVGAGAAAAGGIAAGCPGPGGSTSSDTGGADGATRDSAAGGPDSAETSDSADMSDGGGEPDVADGTDTAEDADSCSETGSDVKGPFHEDGAPERMKLAPDDEPGERIVIEGTVYEPDCQTPIEGAMLDVWHANDDGTYYEAPDYRLRGQLQTDQDGSYEIRTIKPGRYRQAGGLRPAHVHFNVSVPQFSPLTTQMYFAGDPYLGPEDSCGGCGSDDPTLIVDFQTEQREGNEVLVGTFDIVLGA